MVHRKNNKRICFSFKTYQTVRFFFAFFSRFKNPYIVDETLKTGDFWNPIDLIFWQNVGGRFSITTYAFFWTAPVGSKFSRQLNYLSIIWLRLSASVWMWCCLLFLFSETYLNSPVYFLGDLEVNYVCPKCE